MPRDTSALPVQGPDNGTGNPILVTTTAAETVRTNLVQIAGVGVQTGAAGTQRVSIVDTNGSSIVAATAGDVVNSLQIAQPGGNIQHDTAAANTAVVVTYAAVAGQQRRLKHLSVFFEGANAAVQLTAVWGGVTRIILPVPAGQNTILQLNLPDKGVGSGAADALVITLPAGGAGVIGRVNSSVDTW